MQIEEGLVVKMLTHLSKEYYGVYSGQSASLPFVPTEVLLKIK